MKNLVLFFVFILGVPIVWAAPNLTAEPYPAVTLTQRAEMFSMITNLRPTLAWRAAVMQRMLGEANYFADRLKLPTKRPIEITDIQDEFIARPWSSMLPGASHLYDTSIPREQRLQMLQFGPFGRIDTANFEFSFMQGKLSHVMRLDGPETEYYSRRLGELVGKPSLIDTNGAYQLATQWLAAVNVDVAALEKQFGYSVNQLQYQPHGATNSILLPLYYVGLGTNNNPKWKPVSFDPAVEVEILGTTKELQDLEINDVSFSHRLLLITNTLELTHTPNPSPKQLQNPTIMQAYQLTPTLVSNYAGNMPLKRFPISTNFP